MYNVEQFEKAIHNLRKGVVLQEVNLRRKDVVKFRGHIDGVPVMWNFIGLAFLDGNREPSLDLKFDETTE